MTSNRQKKKRLFMRAFVMTLLMALFTPIAQAQTTTIYMRDGSTTIERSSGVIYFYDSHGPATVPECWNYWYQHNEDFTYVFKPKVAGDKIKVTFNSFLCYNNDVEIGNWALRLNDDFLYVYEGNGVNADNLIAALTGNSAQSFSVMADGAITFRFVSNARYREEGWYATVELVQENVGMSPQAPFIRRSTCDNAAELLPTTLGAQIWYTTDGTDPTTSTTAELYKGEIDFPVSGNLTVNAASKLANGDEWSTVVSTTFTDADRIPVPGVPTITREANSNVVVMTPDAVPDGVNETYIVRYTFTTNGNEPAEPDLTNSTLYTGPITCTTPNTWYKAKTFGLSCSNWVSEETAELQVNTIYCPEPEISFGDDMFILATEGGVTYSILYTLDGSEPSLSPLNGTQSSTTVSLAGIAYGTTVKALAFKMNSTDVDTQYQPSAVVSAIYVPTDENGNTQNGTYGGIVLIDDREDHSWSYYSDADNPIRKLNPADVKITYFGNGTSTMTSTSENGDNPTTFSEDAIGVRVNVDAPENQFVYIKTLENDDQDGNGNYSYTTIPNPFQVRPIHQSNKRGEQAAENHSKNVYQPRENMPQGELMKAPDAMGTETAHAMPQSTLPRQSQGSRDVTYEKVTASQTDWSGTYLLVYDRTTTSGLAFTSVSTDSIGEYTTLTMTNSGSTITSNGEAALLTVAPYSGNSSYYTIQINGGNYLLSGTNGFCTSSAATNSSGNYYCYWNISYSSDGISIYCPAWNSTYPIKFYYGSSNRYFVETTSTGSSYHTPNLYKQTTSGGGDGTDCDTEDFTGTTVATYNASTYYMPEGWNSYSSADSYCYPPRVSNSTSYTYIDELTGNYLLMTAYGTSGTYAAYAIMPQYSDITSVTFNYVYESTGDSYGTLSVGYVTSNDGYSTYTVLDTPTKSGSKTSYSLSAANIATINANNGYIAFRYLSSGASTYYSVGIDDVVVCTASATTPSIVVSPSTATVVVNNTVQLTATSANASGAAITWSSSNTSVATVVTDSKDTSTATVTGVAAGSAEITASITVDGTTYTASSVITVVTPSYCTPEPTSIDGTGIHPVVFGSGSEIVNNTVYPTGSPYYGDYSSQIGAYMQGATASVEITYNTGYTYGTLIWVDWDNSYTFDDDEIVASGTSTSTSGSSMTFTFTVPSTQAVGYYRMRIGAADSYFDSYISGTTTGAHDPCSTGTYKVFHDYTLHVTAAVEAPAAPVFSLASGTYTEAQTVTITCATSDAEIYYTTDGSNPSNTNGTLITSGATVTISTTTTLKAVAYNGALSAITSATYYISTSGGGSLDCEDFESYSSNANSSYNTAGSLPDGWTWYYQTNYHGNSDYAPHLYTGMLAMDGVGIVMTAGYDSYDSDGGGSSTTYIGRAYYLVSNIVLQEGATVSFNTWVESTSYGTMTYGYMVGTSFYSLGTATTAYYSGATNADGVTSFTVSSEANGYPLVFRWVYSTSTSGSNYSAVIDNICQETTGAPNAPVFDLAEGDYTGTQTVTITCSTADATIYYTTDGTEPSAANGTAISSGGTVTITTTTTLQAVAVNAYGASALTSATYTITQGASSNSDYRGFYAWRVKRVSDGLAIKSKDGNTTYAVGGVIPAETEIQFVTENEEGNEVEFEALWAQAYVTTTTSTSGLNANVGYERNFMVLGSNPGTTESNVLIPTSSSTTTNGQYIPLYVSSSSYPYSLSQQIYTASEINASGTISAIAFRVYSSSSSNRTLHIYMAHTTRTTFDYDDDWGAYATVAQSASSLVYSGTVNFNSTGWKNITLDTPFEYNGTSNVLITVFDVTGTYMSTPPTFYTSSTSNYSSVYAIRSSAYTETGYYFAASGRLAYHPQLRLTFTSSDVSGVSVPMTITTYNPDGTGGTGSSSVVLADNIVAGADLKFENIKMNSISTLNGNGHSLVVGRGVTAGSSGVCAANVYGYHFSSTPTSAINFKLRLESGVFNNVFGLYGSSTSLASAETNVGITMGSDYDRANSENGLFQIPGTYSLTYSITGATATSEFVSQVYSGTFTCATDEYYMGYWNSSSMKAVRYNTIYGGDFVNGVTLGIDQSSSADTETAFLRIYGGTFQQQLYGAGQYAQAKGSRRMVITGGTFGDWIAAGCYGTNPSGGYLDGNTALYFGGKANQTSDEGIFGSGYGTTEVYGTADEDSYYVNASTVVVADQAQVAGSVYGGGNNGFAQNSSDVHILGGTIGGNVFGGANKSKGATITVNVEDGSITGNVYGGSNTTGAISGLATINVSGGAADNVFGGGYGSTTMMNNGTKVNITGGTLSGNVYGGGEEGKLVGSASNATPNSDAVITMSGGTVNDVFGAGKGGNGNNANVSGNTTITISGGTVNGAVYGGGENGTINPENAYAESTTTTQDEVKTVGTSAGSSNTYGPVNNYYNYGYIQTIYPSSSLVAGTIKSIAYNYNYTTNLTNKSVTIYMGTTSNNASTSWISLSNLTPVFTGTLSCSSGWNTFTLSTPFEYDGSNNLVVVVHDQTGSYTGSSSTYTFSYASNSSYNVSRYYWSDSSISTTPSSSYGTSTGYYPVTRFTITTSTTTTSDTEAPENLISTVTVSGGDVKGDVFGGGKMGTTNGSTFVNVTGGILRQNVFGGAYGEHGSVFVGGPKTVNVMGGHVYGSIYGGSRNANDGNALNINADTFDSSTETATTSVTNITGGQIDQHVYAAGYYGNTFGSVYAFLGINAVQNAPNKNPNTGAANLEYTKSKLVIDGTIWAGGDWGTFSGSFGDPTVTGNSNIYIDGEGYSTDGNDPSVNNYMNIAGSILGSGTSCDAGKGERTLVIRNYGADIANNGDDSDVNPFAYASRQSNSIQRFHNVILDNTHMGFLGQGKINSLNNTEKYSLYEVDENVYVANGSTLVMNAPSSQIKSFHSVTCDDTYATTPAYTVVNYDGLGAAGSETDNKVRVNGGSYVEVRYFEDPDNPATGEKSYGELEGFCHIMTSNDSEDATCAYARPKQSLETGNIIPASEDNRDDGGFVAYLGRYNQYTADGDLVSEGEQVQVRYENHTPNMRDNSEYFRIWRYGGNHHYIEGIFNAEATTEGDDYKTVTVTIQLPAWTGNGSYYRFDRTGTSSLNTLIDYGSDVLTYNAACYTDPTTGNNWMYFDYDNDTQVSGVGTANETLAANIAAGIDDNPNLNYGLVITPGQAMNGITYIINGDADEYLANLETPFTCADNTKVPTVTFTLTYSNSLTANMTWDPMLIPLVQCSEDGTITDYVTIALTINTSTEITSGFTTQVYARMNGGTNVKETATVNVVLPTFNVAQTGEEAQFTLVKAEFTPDQAIDPYSGDVATSGYEVTYVAKTSESLNMNNFGLTIAAVANPDNTDDWRFVTGEQDGAPGNGTGLDLAIGQAGGRSALTFGVTLYYNSNEEVNAQTHMGDVTFTIGFTNFSGGDPDNDYYSEFTVTVEVYRIGSGKNFYVDGINGVDASDENRGKFPDKPAKTINYIFNRLGFLPGDNIFVVDNLPISKATTWDGSAFQNEVNVYRYPGGHAVSGENPDFDNSPYTGALVDITKELTMRGITMDGMYAEAQTEEHNSSLYPDACTFDGEANAPLIIVEEEGRLNLTSVTTLMNNYNGNNAVHGGAVNVAYGGILAMNMASSITNNINSTGGAVYMDGSMIVSDSIFVYNNYMTSGMDHQNNVYLAQKTQGNFRVVQIGTAKADAYDELQVPTQSTLVTKIGVSKEDWSNTYEGYMPVVYAESGTESFLDTPYDNQSLIVHDENIYSLERYVTDLHSDSPLYLYWLGTWVTAQRWNPYFESADEEGYTAYMTAEQLANISTPQQLAWVISLANGENGVDKTNASYLLDNVVITDDIDMSANIWVPIGNEDGAFTGTFEGNGHVVSGLTSPLNRTNMGMFGVTDGAIISDMVVNAQFNTTSANMGAVVGTMNGGVLSNVEGAGTLTNNYANGNTGGLVGVNASLEGGTTAGVIHSSFAATDITGGNAIGGLVAVNNGDLINAYSNVTMSGATTMGGLVATNNGHIENCYNVTETTYPFAAVNNGTILYSYAATGTTDYVGTESTGSLDGHGTYDIVKGRKELGYMYYDNAVTAINSYVIDTVSYSGGKINKWPGLLSTLNQWVAANSSNELTYTNWYRPTSTDINGDLPVLAFPKDNCLATEDGKFLYYGAADEIVDGKQANNGLDNLLTNYADKEANIFLYNSATNVEQLPTANVHVFINEDAALLQKQIEGVSSAPNFINTTVGVSFDNSNGTSGNTDYYGGDLLYDWHLMATPLYNAPMGISWSSGQVNWWDDEDWDDNVGQVTGVENSYLPDGTADSDFAHWDFYTYYEPQYHWINFKRNIDSHFHFDEPHDNIPYNFAESEQVTGNLLAGRGYMAAIDQDSYLNNTGTLNNGSVTIKLTADAPNDDAPDGFFTYDRGANLIGNPYQAYLDLSVVAQKSNYTKFYIYDAAQNTYVPFVAGSSKNPVQAKTIHPHQAFFVLTDTVTNPESFTFTYEMATTEKDENSYFRGNSIDYPVVNLFVNNEKGHRDLTIIELGRPELGGALKTNALRSANFKIGAHHQGKNYGLLFAPEGTERIPVHFKTNEDGVFTLTWNTYNGDFTSLILVDNLMGTRCDMLRNDHYTFNGSADDYAARFYITYNVTDVNELNGNDEAFAWFDGNDWIVTGKGMLQVVDVTGRVLQAVNLEGEQTRLHLDGVAAGVYVMHLTDGKKSVSQKIVVK